jgi:hypothetical protein
MVTSIAVGSDQRKNALDMTHAESQLDFLVVLTQLTAIEINFRILSLPDPVSERGELSLLLIKLRRPGNDRVSFPKTSLKKR